MAPTPAANLRVSSQQVQAGCSSVASALFSGGSDTSLQLGLLKMGVLFPKGDWGSLLNLKKGHTQKGAQILLVLPSSRGLHQVFQICQSRSRDFTLQVHFLRHFFVFVWFKINK